MFKTMFACTTQRTMPPLRGDEEIIKHLRIFGSLVLLLLTLLNVLFLVNMIGSAEKVDKMLALSRDMNASTSRTMGRIHDLLEGIEPSQTQAIVANALQVSEDLRFIVGSVANSGNLTALTKNVKKVVAAIDTNALSAALGDAATIAHALTGSAQRVKTVVALIDPAVVREIVDNVRNVTHEMRRVASSHNLRLNF